MSPPRDPFSNFDRMRRQIDELFGDVWSRAGISPNRRAFSPRVDVYYYGDPPKAVIKADLAGVDPNEVNLEVRGRVLVISGERKARDTCRARRLAGWCEFHRELTGLLIGASGATAVIAYNDIVALGLMSRLAARDVAVPDRISVLGCDDIPMSAYVEPPLSSVHVDISALGERATVRLLEAMQPANGHPVRREVLPTTLVVRRSCGASRAP